MSLVNEALKKARLEAARQDAARRGIPLPGAQRPPARSIGPAVFFRAGLVAATVAIAVLIFFAGRRSSTSPVEMPEQVATSEPAALTTEPDAIEVVSSEAAPPPVASIVEVPEPAPPPAQADSSAPASAVRARETDPAATTDSRTAPSRAPQSRVRTEWADPTVAAPVPTPAPASPGPAEATPRRAVPSEPAVEAPAAELPQTVVRKLELAGSVRIELGGIAWSEERPFALINGRVVGPGDSVEKLTVVAIEPRHVELRGTEGHYLLRLK